MYCPKSECTSPKRNRTSIVLGVKTSGRGNLLYVYIDLLLNERMYYAHTQLY